MPSIAPPRFEWHDLPPTPYNKERAFAIFAPQIETQQDIVLPDLGVTWAGSPKYVRDVERVTKEALQAYKLRWHQKAGQGRQFFYGRALTDEERLVPYHEWRVRRPHYWPTVLLKLWFEIAGADMPPLSARGADNEIRETPRILDHARFRDGGEFPTTFIIRHYWSDEPWPISAFNGIIPMTDTVRWDFLSNQGAFPESLHGECAFPSFQTPGSVLFGAGTKETEIGSDLVAQKYDATPMEDWEQYKVEVTPREIFGMWFREDIIALPPIDDREART